MSINVWDGIAYLFWNINGCIVEVRGRDIMAHILQTTFWNLFSRIKTVVSWFTFHQNLRPWLQFTIHQYRFRQWRGANHATSHCPHQWYPSLRPRWVRYQFLCNNINCIGTSLLCIEARWLPQWTLWPFLLPFYGNRFHEHTTFKWYSSVCRFHHCVNATRCSWKR